MWKACAIALACAALLMLPGGAARERPHAGAVRGAARGRRSWR